MTEEIKLKPCPFCGGEAEIIDDVMGTISRCRYCGAENGNGFYGEGGHKLALEDWNTRPIEDDLREENRKLREALKLIEKARFYFARGEEEKQIRRVYEIAEEALKGEE